MRKGLILIMMLFCSMSAEAVITPITKQECVQQCADTSIMIAFDCIFHTDSGIHYCASSAFARFLTLCSLDCFPHVLVSGSTNSHAKQCISQASNFATHEMTHCAASKTKMETCQNNVKASLTQSLKRCDLDN